MATYLKDTHPHFEDEWVAEKNAELGFEFEKMTTKANKKAWFVCPIGHEYLALISTRTSYGSGCGYCSNKQLLAGFNDLGTVNPELASEWHPTKNGELTPQDVFPGGKASIWWQCTEGHEWEAKLYSRHSQGVGCKQCSSAPRKVKVDEDKLTIEWMEESNGKPLSAFTRQANVSGWWKCSDCGHKWEARIAERRNGSNCAVCLGLKIAHGINDLSALFPDLFAQINVELELERDLSVVPTKSKDSVNWLHPDCGHEWVETIQARTRKKNPSACSVCSGRKVQSGANDFFTLYPDLLVEWDAEANTGIDVASVSRGSGVKRHWKCPSGHGYLESPARRSNGTGCPVCSGAVIVPGFNDFATLYPDLMEEWDFELNTVDPSTLSKASDVRVFWVCSKNADHKWDAVANSRLGYVNNKGTGCPHCANRVVTVGVNDFASVHSDLLKEWDFERNAVTPDSLAFGSGERVWWVCSRDASHAGWEAKLSERSRGQGVCPACFAFVSINERLIADWFAEQGETVVSGDRKVLGGKELDVLLPERGFAVEYNGVYWHSGAHKRGGLYHYGKFVGAADAGVRLVQVWEDEFNGARFSQVAGFLGLCLSESSEGSVLAFEGWADVEAWVVEHSWWLPVGVSRFDWLTVRGSGGTLEGVVGVRTGTPSGASVEFVLLPGTDSHGLGGRLSEGLLERYGSVSGAVRCDFGEDILFASAGWVNVGHEVDSYVFTVGTSGRLPANTLAEGLHGVGVHIGEGGSVIALSSFPRMNIQVSPYCLQCLLF